VSLNPIDKFAFMIRLPHLNSMPLTLRKLAEHLINVHKQCLTIYLALPLSQKIQVRSVYHKNARHACSSSMPGEALRQGNPAKIPSALALPSELIKPPFQLGHNLL
jgi:hypothetical protein